MSELVKLRTDQIAPSQDFLKPGTVKFIFECIGSGNLESLPPTPIIRQDANGAYVAIDGHNLIAVRAFRHEDIEVYVATNADDGLPPESPRNEIRNTDLRTKFETVLSERDKIAAEGVRSFHDLIQRNEELFRENI
jgi:hypothetical protein